MPIFHPGTIMFLSAVKSSSPRARFDKEKHQVNDLIMGPREAVYLAAFITDLSSVYQEEVSRDPSFDQNAFHKTVFEKVLKQKLEEYQEEDAEKFGR